MTIIVKINILRDCKPRIVPRGSIGTVIFSFGVNIEKDTYSFRISRIFRNGIHHGKIGG
jgi:hypothetical protein